MPQRQLTVALFRAREDALASAAALGARRLGAALAPVLEICALETLPPDGAFDYALATSAKAIAHAALDVARALPLHVVGEKTAEAARRAGLRVKTIAPDVAALTLGLPDGRALYLAGRDRKPELEAALAGRVAVWEVYEARRRPGWSEAEAQAAAEAVAALHYSPRSAALAAEFAESSGFAARFRGVPHVCLSREVAARLAAFGATRAFWPREPDEASLLDTLESALADFPPPGRLKSGLP